jgi:hypothetical protein
MQKLLFHAILLKFLVWLAVAVAPWVAMYALGYEIFDA